MTLSKSFQISIKFLNVDLREIEQNLEDCVTVDSLFTSVSLNSYLMISKHDNIDYYRSSTDELIQNDVMSFAISFIFIANIHECV